MLCHLSKLGGAMEPRGNDRMTENDKRGTLQVYISVILKCNPPADPESGFAQLLEHVTSLWRLFLPEAGPEYS